MASFMRLLVALTRCDYLREFAFRVYGIALADYFGITAEVLAEIVE